jgi:hypothetical protein
MRQYSAAIYANENLLLTEAIERLEEVLPTVEIRIYSSNMAGSTINTELEEYSVYPADEIKEEEILLVLSDTGDDFQKLKDFDGTVVDFTGAFEGVHDEVYPIEEPIAHILKSIEANPADMEAVATVPAALFGKSGIDDMLNQTRELFAFTNSENKIFEERLAFNMFFSDADQGILAGYKQKLEMDTGIKADVRMVPVSTGFVLDVYFKKDVNKEFAYIADSPGFLATMSDVCELPRPVILSKSDNRVTFAGDYIDTVSRQIIEAIKDITGVE